MNEQTGVFRLNAQGSNQENWCQGQGNQGRNYGSYNREVNYDRDGNYNHDNNFKRGNYGHKNDRSGPYVPPQIGKLLLGVVEVLWCEFKVCCKI